MKRHFNEISLDNEVRYRYISAIYGIMVFLIIVLLSVSFSVSDAYHKWQMITHHRYTIFMPAIEHNMESFTNQQRQSDNADRPHSTVNIHQILEQSLAYVKTLPHIVRIDIANPQKIKNAMRPLSASVSMRYVLEIDVKPGKQLPLQAVQKKLHQIHDHITIEPQHKKQKNLESLIHFVQWITNLFIGVIVLCILILMILATRSAVNSQKNVIDTLRLLGARPHYIAKLYQGPVFKVTLLGGGIGALGAFAGMHGVCALIQSMEEFSGIVQYPDEYSHVLILMLTPLVMSLLSYIITRLTVFKTLRAMHYA